MEKEDLISLTADIVSAHVANNNVSVGDLPVLIGNVHAALAGLGEPPAMPQPEEKKPAVSIRASLKPDHLVCLECGARQKTLKRHLATAHALSPADYRSRFGLPSSYPMIAPAYAEQRRAMAHAIGLGRKGSGKSKSGGKGAGKSASARNDSGRRAPARGKAAPGPGSRGRK